MIQREKKIFLNREDDLKLAVDRVISTEAKRVILNIPKGSVLGGTVQNFHVLRRESITAGKQLSIESVDDHVLELASLAKIEAANPVFRIRERTVSDILPRTILPHKETELVNAIDREKITDSVPRSTLVSAELPLPPKKKITSFFNERPPKPVFRRKTNYRRRIIIVLIIILILGGSFGLAAAVLPKATVTLNLEKTPAAFDYLVEISSKISEVAFSSEGLVVPGELIQARKNLEMSFKTANKVNVERKATAKIAVYNAYSSEPQALVASTRFESPDQKIFRLTAPIIVPGAKIKDRQIVPSKIEVTVVADKAGQEYNLISGGRWRIPGFAGSAKYDGFYAELLAPASGGFVGSVPSPSETEVAKAKESLASALKDVLRGQLAVVQKKNLKFLDELLSFRMIKEEVKIDIGNPEEFTVFGEGEIKTMAFDENVLKKSIIEKAGSSLPVGYKTKVSDFTITYGRPTGVDLETGKFTFRVNGKAVFIPELNLDNLKANLIGRTETDLKAIIFSLPGLHRATVELWPFWVRRVPRDVAKISIVIN